MLYYDNDEEKAARVEKMLEEFHRGSAAAEPAMFVLLTGWPGTALPVTAKRNLVLVSKSKQVRRPSSVRARHRFQP